MLCGRRSEPSVGLGHLSAIPKRPDVQSALDFEKAVSDHAAVLAFGEIETIDDRMRRTGNCRNQRARRNLFTSRENCLLSGRRFQPGVQSDVAAALATPR